MKVLPEYRNFRIPDWMLPVFALMNSGRSAARCPGDRVHRAAARLTQHRLRFDGIDLTPIPSRQQRRADERAFMKQVRSADKAEAQRSSAMGGAAACR